MIFILENGVMDTDLNASGYRIFNLLDLVPLPSTICSSTDPRLSDPRVPPNASIVDAMVAPAAGIQQSKLSLNGNMPSAWLGTTAGLAAPGNLAEYVANKGQPGGYPALDSTGKVPPAQMPVGAGTGTVTSVGLSFPSGFLVPTGSPIVGSGTFVVNWAAQSALSWFGNPSSSASAPPTFNTGPLPVSLIPSLDASKIATGVFALARIPPAVGLGASHASGIVPDPGSGTSSDGTAAALATDYLGRDMAYHPIPVVPSSYRPVLAPLVLTPSTNVTGPKTVTPTAGSASIIMFYSLTGASGPFTQFGIATDPTGIGYVSVPPLATAWFYSSAVGFQDSAVQSYTNPNTS